MLAIAVLLAFCALSEAGIPVRGPAFLKADYAIYLSKYYPNYVPDNSTHSQKRFAQFCKHYMNVYNWNHAAAGYKIGVNKFSHWTDEEIQSSLNPSMNDGAVSASTADALRKASAHLNVRALPVNFSWADQGKVASVKDQGQCGSCYTFAAGAALESAYAIKYGVVYDLSPQQYVDCAYGYGASTMNTWSSSCRTTNGVKVCTTTNNTYEAWSSTSGNKGCNGGQPKSCYAYNNMTGSSQDLLSCYPYTSGTSIMNGQCAYSSSSGCSVGLSVKGYGVVAPDEVSMQNALYTYGPLACGMDASLLSVMQYNGGIYNGDGNCSTTTNHAITVVGYGVDASNNSFWYIKNSWGADWGDNGFFYLTRGSNTCGIATNCVYPILH